MLATRAYAASIVGIINRECGGDSYLVYRILSETKLYPAFPELDGVRFKDGSHTAHAVRSNPGLSRMPAKWADPARALYDTLRGEGVSFLKARQQCRDWLRERTFEDRAILDQSCAHARAGWSHDRVIAFIKKEDAKARQRWQQDLLPAKPRPSAPKGP